MSVVPSISAADNSPRTRFPSLPARVDPSNGGDRDRQQGEKNPESVKPWHSVAGGPRYAAVYGAVGGSHIEKLGEITETVTTSYSRSFSISFGLDIGLYSNVERVVNGNSGLSLGFQWSQSWSWSTASTCNVDSDVQVAQVFARTVMSTAETATRICEASVLEGTVCGDWTFGSFDYPLKTNGQPAFKYGCSRRPNNVRCDVPVGTRYCGERQVES
jgi:hypothetical protein